MQQDGSRSEVEGLRPPHEIVAALRNSSRRASRELAAWARLLADADKFGVYSLGPGEPIDERELLGFLQRARREHPQQVLRIQVIAHEGRDKGDTDERSNRNGRAQERDRAGGPGAAAGR